MEYIVLVLFFALILWLFQGREDGPTRKEYEDHINSSRKENAKYGTWHKSKKKNG